MSIEKIIEYHIKKYPEMQMQDVFKLLFQNEFGGEHLIEDRGEFEKYLSQELAQIRNNDKSLPENELLEDIGNQTLRIQLSEVEEKLFTKTLTKLCIISAKRGKGSTKSLLEKLQIVRKMAQQQMLPFPSEDIQAQIEKYAKEGFPSVHHSKQYRELYHPHYRLVSAEVALYLPVFMAVEAQLQKGENIMVAVDGMAAAGKTSLASLLQQVYACEILHADDFFLQTSQRTAQRLEEVGGNIDYERMEKVVSSLRQGGKTNYKPYNCGTQKLGEGREITPQRLIVVEGSYTMHKKMIENYDFKIYLSCSGETQKQRILQRNGPKMLERFIEEWIPKEKAYADTEKIKAKSDFSLDTSFL